MSANNAIRTVARSGTLNLQRSLALVAEAFGRKTGVRIAIGGSVAWTNGSLITLPAVDETNPRTMQLVWGYLAHEAGHVRFTDFDALARMAAEGHTLLKSVWNILEDVRIENAMIGEYPGTRSTMDVTVEAVLRERDGFVSETDPPARILVDALLVLARHQYRKQAFLQPKTEEALRVLRKVFPSTFALRLQGLMGAIPAVRSTQDTINLARRIIALVEDEAQAEPPDPASRDDDAEPGADDDGSGTGDASDGTTQNTDDGHGGGDDAGGDNGDSDAGAARAESASGDDSGTRDSGGEGPEQNDDHDNGDGDDSHRPGEGNDAASSAGSVSPQQGSDSRAGDEAGEQGSDDGVGGRLALRGALKADQEDLPDDLFSAVAKELEALVKRGENRFPEARPCDGDTDAGARLVDRVMGETRRLTAQLHGIVQSETMTRHRTARRGRRLSAPHLHRVAVGDDRVFDRIEERRAPNTAIHLLVDMSGSMDPPKCTLAMDAALALALALESMRGVSLAATAFPHVEWHSDNANAVTAMLLRGQSVRARAGAFVQRARGGTPLTAALWFTAAELLAASEPRKVAIVLTDGEPNDRHSAWDIVQRMAAAGIETVGIGIFYEVSWLFPTHVTISRLNQLKPELMRIARQLLIA